MSLSRKIILSLIGSIVFIAMINIASFYLYSKIFLKMYLVDTVQTKEEISKDYIDTIIEKQAIDEVDNVFNNIEIQFYELLDKNKWKIKLDTKENIDLVVNYLIKVGVQMKYIEQIIPQNYLGKIIEDIQDAKSPEYIFFHRLIQAIFITNIFAFSVLILFIFLFTKRILQPIEKTTHIIKELKLWKDFRVIPYHKKDEIWLLVNAINGLNIKLNIWENIRNKLLADISHELKTPITAIQCYIEWLKDETIKLNPQVLDSIIYEMQRLVKLVNTIMEFEKFENKKIELDKKPHDVRFLTQQIINQFKQKLKNTSQKITTSGLHKKVELDKDTYTQIVQNIISNFIKYAWPRTLLNIEFWSNFIKFQDNGGWISKQELPYIKEKFYQGKQPKTWDIDERGIGIWLSVIEKIVRAHGWDIEISSEENNWFCIKIITKTSH